MATEDASATYRGFRNQALYVLYRILTDENASERVYRPEGAEDLAVFNSEMHLVEVIQVKDYKGELSLSALKPKSERGFFVRLKRRMAQHPRCITKLASFGPIGPELSGAINNESKDDKKHRANVVTKISVDKTLVSTHDAHAMLDGLKGNIVHPSESDLRSSIAAAIQGTCVAGEIACSIGLLKQWVFEASEQQKDLTRQSLLDQIDRIGRYLAELRDSSAEWGTSISQIRSLDLQQDEVSQLVAEYRRGVQARWEHIVAGADCERPDRLDTIHRQMQAHSVVILRGASGQGKSTLGWRYLHDFCTDGLRFHIRFVDGREQAARIANAFGSHVTRLKLKAVVFLDVSHADVGWSELVRSLAASGLKVLVAVREEDFRRANIASCDFSYSEIVLDRVTKEEAELIFLAMGTSTSSQSLDFEEAWARFASDEGGPLLEFTHLVSEGESLLSRIASQIRKIQDDSIANGLISTQLEMLALAAVANETGARVSYTQLCDLVEVDPVTSPLRVLENEYLVRLQDECGKTSIAGLHQLRSRAIAEVLFRDLPELREKYSIRVLSIVSDEDIESYLLDIFSRRTEFSDRVVDHVSNVSLRSWTHAAGIARAIIWEGVSRYEMRNRETILSAIEKYGSGWAIVCDSFVGLDDESYLEIQESFDRAFATEFPRVLLSPKSEVFALFCDWASTAIPPPPPILPRDWPSAGDVAFWLVHTRTYGLLRDALLGVLPRPFPNDLSINDLGRFISGRARLDDLAFREWYRLEKESIVQALLDATDSAYIADDGQEVVIYFQVPLADSIADSIPDADDWHGQSMKRVDQLRQLFPDREIYGSQGLGFEMLGEVIGHDPTYKRIPAKSLPPDRSVLLNSIFTSLVAYRHGRPNSWKDYTDVILAYRKAVSACFRKLHRGWSKLYLESTPSKETILGLLGMEIARVAELSKLPMFPRCAVDEWGLTSEEKERRKSSIRAMQLRSIRRFDSWRTAFRKFESGVGFVVSNIVILTAGYVAKRSIVASNEESDRTPGLFLANLGDSWEVLRDMQREFRERFGHLYSQRTLDELEMHERTNFRQVWDATVAVAFEQCGSTVRSHQATLAERKRQFIQAIAREVSEVMKGRGEAYVQENPLIIDGTPHLCVVVNYRNLEADEAIIPSIVRAIWHAAKNLSWTLLEWKPLEIEWPKIAIVNLVCGRALTPSCIRLYTRVMTSASDTFEVKLHHQVPTPMRSDEFASGGFFVWENPVLRAIIALQSDVMAFYLTVFRYFELTRLVFDCDLDAKSTNRILNKFGNELQVLLNYAQSSLSQVILILNAMSSNSALSCRDELQEVTRKILFDTADDERIVFDLDQFDTWTRASEEVNARFQTLVTKIVVHVVNQAAESTMVTT